MTDRPEYLKRRPHLSVRRGTSTEITLACRCPMCHEQHDVTCSLAGLKAWIGGELIQCALPDLSDLQREQLMTGYCQPCWDKMFPDEDEDRWEGLLDPDAKGVPEVGA